MPVELYSEPVLTAVCFEPGGEVERAVYPMMLTVDNLRVFWEKSRQFKNLFDVHVNGDFKTFCELFLRNGVDGTVESNGLFWVVDDFVGVFYMTDIRIGFDAKTHYVFFDRRHRGRVHLAREMLKYVFMKYNFRRLSTEVPLYATPAVIDFIRACGFAREGRRRKGAWYSGGENPDWFDVLSFGILKEEALNME